MHSVLPSPSLPRRRLQEERARKYAQEVQSLQFNVLVTTYEFIMRDRTKLSKVGSLLQLSILFVPLENIFWGVGVG
jgi:hypothetical protein